MTWVSIEPEEGTPCRHKEDTRPLIYVGNYGCGRMMCGFCDDGLVFCRWANRVQNDPGDGGHWKLVELLFNPRDLRAA